MHDKELYSQILDIRMPWEVTEVLLDRVKREVRVRVEWHPSESLRCAECAGGCSQYDRRERSWRRLDTCQYKTILTASIPRVRSPEHGVRHVEVPWAEPGLRFTALFERLVID